MRSRADPRRADRPGEPAVRRRVRAASEGPVAPERTHDHPIPPTPSGYLHLGNAVNILSSRGWLRPMEERWRCGSTTPMRRAAARSTSMTSSRPWTGWASPGTSARPTSPTSRLTTPLRRRTERYRGERDSSPRAWPRALRLPMLPAQVLRGAIQPAAGSLPRSRSSSTSLAETIHPGDEWPSGKVTRGDRRLSCCRAT